MATSILFIRRSDPSDQPTYGDGCTVCREGAAATGEYACRTWPNPFRPSDQVPCEQAYGAIAPGTYPGVLVPNHPKFGRCIEIAGGGELPGMWPDVNDGNRSVVSQVFVHHGYSETWSGSAGCLTIDPVQADGFFGIFADNEALGIELTTP